MQAKAIAAKAIANAAKHVKPSSTLTSEALCLQDAKACYAKGSYSAAINRAVDSLKYSVGVFSDTYQETIRETT